MDVFIAKKIKPPFVKKIRVSEVWDSPRPDSPDDLHCEVTNVVNKEEKKFQLKKFQNKLKNTVIWIFLFKKKLTKNILL